MPWRRFLRPIPAFLLLVVLVLVGCGQGGFGRADAIERFQVAGSSEAEARCMAEALIVLDELDVANPQITPDESGVAALVTAGHSCILE